MPVVASAPYPRVSDTLIAAKALCNDMAQSVLGNMLADNQPFVLPLCDLAHKTLRKMLARAGVNTYFEYQVITGLTASATSDPTVQMQLTYTGYFNGGEPASTPALPSDLLEPLELWERQSATINRWSPMKQAADSITCAQIESAFGLWDWESDILYLPGCSQSNDIKLKYLKVTPRLTSTNQQIPIMDCDMAMGALIAELLSASRGGAAAAAFHARAADEVALLVDPTAKKEQYGTYVRRPFRATRAGRGRR